MKNTVLKILMSDKENEQLATIKARAKKMNVLNISFSGATESNDFACMESVLNIIEEHRDDISKKAKEKQGLHL